MAIISNASSGNGESTFFFNVFKIYLLFSLDQLEVSTGDQQRLQAVLSSVGSKSSTLTLIQEAKAQSEVSEMQRTHKEENSSSISGQVPVASSDSQGGRAWSWKAWPG